MSGSARKHLRWADEALRHMLDTAERYPDAKADLIARLGERHYAELVRAAATVRGAAARLDEGDSAAPHGAAADDVV